MRTVTKQSLDVLARTMSVIPMSKLNGFVGGYSDDCFWRCIAYLNSGGSSYSESDAESYAYGYFSNLYGGYTSAYLTSLGAGMSLSDINNYKSYSGNSVDFSRISVINYGNNEGHAVVYLGSSVHYIAGQAITYYNYFDPQNNQTIDSLIKHESV